MLKTIVWKECRELAPWTALALIGISLYIAYTMRQMLDLLGEGINPDPVGLIGNVYVQAGPILAIALALLQNVPERRRDRWAFLAHRPVAWSTIFAGKAIAGIGAYLVATLVPLFGALLWIAHPGNVPAPFYWQMAQGPIDEVVSYGVLLYFAGVLIAIRPARWYGSRALPLLTAVLICIFLGKSRPNAPRGVPHSANCVGLGLCLCGSARVSRRRRLPDSTPRFAASPVRHPMAGDVRTLCGCSNPALRTACK